MAAKAYTALELVRHALRQQSHGGALGRYYVQRTLEHLQQCHDNFKEDVVEIQSNVQSSSNHAFQRFIYENIPQLKYRNKHTKFNCTITDDLPTNLTVKFADGASFEINTEQKQADIYKDVVELTRAPCDETAKA